MQLAVTTLILVHLVQGEISKLSKQQLNIINTSASVEKSLSIASVSSVQYVCIEEDIDRSFLLGSGQFITFSCQLCKS